MTTGSSTFGRDHSPYRTNAVASRWPMAVFPSSLFVFDENGVNLTAAAATAEITASFNKLSVQGVKMRSLASHQ